MNRTAEIKKLMGLKKCPICRKFCTQLIGKIDDMDVCYLCEYLVTRARKHPEMVYKPS